MRYLLLLITFYSLSFSSITKSVILYYQFKNYEKACKEEIKIVDKSNEAILSLIGAACAKSDQIDSLAKIAVKLSSKKEFRENRSYFLTLLLQKSLILQFLKDDTNIENLKFPKTDHIISLIFSKITKNEYKTVSKNPKTISIKNADKTYRITFSKTEPSTIIIKEYFQDTVIKIHRIK